MRHKLLSVDQQYNWSKNICVNDNIVAMNSSSSISSTLQKLWLSNQFLNIFKIPKNNPFAEKKAVYLSLVFTILYLYILNAIIMEVC